MNEFGMRAVYGFIGAGAAIALLGAVGLIKPNHAVLIVAAGIAVGLAGDVIHAWAKK